MDRKAKHQVWRKRMEDYESSGQSVQEWISSCQDEITIYQFHYWRKKLKGEKNEVCQNEQNGWTSLDVQGFTTAPTIEVRINDVSVYIPEDVNDTHMIRLLRVLRHV